MSNVQELNEAEFDEKVLQESKPVLIDCWAPSCGPCRLLSPIVNNLGKANEGKALIYKINIATNPTLAAKLGIVSLPTILIYKNGQIVSRLQGVQKQAKLQELLDANS